MGQVLHGSATTTAAVRRAIQNSQESLRALAKRYNINQKTVSKWRKRTCVTDLPTGPQVASSTVLTIEEEGALAIIPSKSNARKLIQHDKNLYAMRNIVERFFCKMKDMRRLATRFEKTAINFQNMIYMFAIKCWIN